jgi:hypothetical protein
MVLLPDCYLLMPLIAAAGGGAKKSPCPAGKRGGAFIAAG